MGLSFGVRQLAVGAVSQWRSTAGRGGKHNTHKTARAETDVESAPKNIV